MLPKSRQGQCSRFAGGQEGGVVSWPDRPNSVPSYPNLALRRRSAVRRLDPTGPWCVRVLDSTGHTSDECVILCVGSQLVFPPLQGGIDDSAGFPDDAFDEADTLQVAVASAECVDCGGLRYSLSEYDL